MLDLLCFWLNLGEVTALVVLTDSSGFQVVEETPELLHPLAIHPLPPPHLQQAIIAPFIISLVHFVGGSSPDVEQIVDVYLYSLAVAESLNKLLSALNPDSAFALLQKVPINCVYKFLPEWQFQLSQLLVKCFDLNLLLLDTVVAPTVIFGASGRQFKKTSVRKLLLDELIHLSCQFMVGLSEQRSLQFLAVLLVDLIEKVGLQVGQFETVRFGCVLLQLLVPPLYLVLT